MSDIQEKVEMRDLVRLVNIAVANNEINGLSFLLKQILDLHEEIKSEVTRLDSDLNTAVFARQTLVRNITKVLNLEQVGGYQGREIPEGIGAEIKQLAELGVPDISGIQLTPAESKAYTKAAEEFSDPAVFGQLSVS